MATKKKRITINMDEELYRTISRLAELQGASRSFVCVDIMESIHQPLMRTVALLDAARQAPDKVKRDLRDTVSQLEGELQRSVGDGINQMEILLESLQDTSSQQGKGRTVRQDVPPPPRP